MNLELTILPNVLAICRLDTDAAVPEWAIGDFVSVTRTPDELSIVCEESAVPRDVVAERGWRALQVVGKLDFSLVGVIASLTGLLAAAKVSVFVISTHDTDYVLVRHDDLHRSINVLTTAGYSCD